uniref:Uncharacterized protein n=1 Tax=Leptobrachium leishanense TaxID=445787 RepID=A0A8C5MJL5_9ANUR
MCSFLLWDTHTHTLRCCSFNSGRRHYPRRARMLSPPAERVHVCVCTKARETKCHRLPKGICRMHPINRRTQLTSRQTRPNRLPKKADQLPNRGMASAELRDELSCFICADIYMNPVILPCGHRFCRVCIGDVLDTQEGSGAYRCPECKTEFKDRPALVKVRKLRKIVESFRSAQPEQEEARILCTYCIQPPAPASKTCLLCEASLCENHLRFHSKSAEHVLTEPIASLERRKCPVHKKVLTCYCCEDATLICASCSLAEQHKGHQVETLKEASEKKKEKQRNILQKLTSQREETEKRLQSLQELRRHTQEQAAGEKERVNALIKEIKKHLESLEKRVLIEISRQEEQVSLRVSGLIRLLEIKKDELSRKMGHIEELCNITDPVTVLQGKESNMAEYCCTEESVNEVKERYNIKVHVGNLDVGLISVTLHSGLAGIVTRLTRRRRVLEASDLLLDVNTVSDILLDVNTASNDVSLSGDMKTVSWSGLNQSRPDRPERFLNNHVISFRSFFSGRHYWEVEGSESGEWVVGMAYSSLDRKIGQLRIGNNSKSWGLWRLKDNQFSVRHNSIDIQLCPNLSCLRFGIFLDYEAGRLSFYELCDQINHIHTFTATFVEPLRAVFGVYGYNTWLKV